jgi:hypothetical protein
MSIRIVQEYPAPAGLRRLMSALASLLGGLLVLAGLLVAPASILHLFAFIEAPNIQSAILILAPIACLLAGLRLVRGKRRLVLFLRRFGFAGATQAVTFAVVRALGANWRLVTLDDARVSPVGTRKRMRWISIAIGVLAAAFVAWLLFWLFGGGFIDSLGPDKPPRAGSPTDVLGLLFVLPIAVLLVGSLVFTVVLLVAAGALAVGVFAWSSYGAVRRAERGKTLEIAHETQIEPMACEVLRKSRRIVGPRLAVARVDSSIWQPVVRRLAAASSALIIDISEPTENLLWEIQTLRTEMGARWILVGEEGHLRRMTDAAQLESSAEARLSRLLDGEQVLAYCADRRDLRRFARSLHARLDALSAAMTAS